MRRLYVISREDWFIGEIEVINCLFNSGMEVFHLRKPGISLKCFDDLLRGIDPAFHQRVVLHQFHEYGPRWGISKFHFSELKRASLLKDKATRYDAAQLSGKNSLSTSIHSLDNAAELDGFEYSFFGPVFDSISKPFYNGILPQDFKLPTQMQRKLVALGGISLENIDEVFEMGFDKAAVLGAVWNDPSQAVKNFKKLQEKCQYAEI